MQDPATANFDISIQDLEDTLEIKLQKINRNEFIEILISKIEEKYAIKTYQEGENLPIIFTTHIVRILGKHISKLNLIKSLYHLNKLENNDLFSSIENLLLTFYTCLNLNSNIILKNNFTFWSNLSRFTFESLRIHNQKVLEKLNNNLEIDYKELQEQVEYFLSFVVPEEDED